MAFALVSCKLNTCLLLRYLLYRHKGNTSYFLSDYPFFPYFFSCDPSCPLQAHASSSDFDFKEPCSKSRVMSLVMYIYIISSDFEACMRKDPFSWLKMIHYDFLSIQTSNSSWILSLCQCRLSSINSNSTFGELELSMLKSLLLILLKLQYY